VSGIARIARVLVLTLAVCPIIMSLGQSTIHQGWTWEMLVCADPASLPFSHENETGFENEIAKILAEELHAKLIFDWWPQGPSMISDRLREGECDLIMGVPEGYGNLLTTLPYYRSPYVFVYPQSSSITVQSLYDPVLRELDIGVQGSGSAPHEALLSLGLSERVVSQYVNQPYVVWDEQEYVEPERRLAPIIEDILSGDIDIGIMWGPAAGFYATQLKESLEITPIQPEVMPPALSMVLTMSIAVRPGDEALRDRLNVAIAEGWEEIHQVLDEYNVPLSPLPRPLGSPTVN
jgi:mxaJ protein